MPKVELTTILMIRDKTTGKVLVQNCIKNWKGLSFPGGHVAFGETSEETLTREFQEEMVEDIAVKRLRWVGEIFFRGETGHVARYAYIMK